MRHPARRRARRTRAAAAAGAGAGSATRRRATAAPSAAAWRTPIPSAELPLVAQVLEARLVLRSQVRHAHAAGRRRSSQAAMTTALAAGRMPRRKSSGRSGASARPARPSPRSAAAMAISPWSRPRAQVAIDDDGTLHARGLRRRRRGADAARLSRACAAARRHAARTRRRCDDVAHDAAAALEPGGDLHASADYRRHLAGVLATRVLQSRLRQPRGPRRERKALFDRGRGERHRHAPARSRRAPRWSTGCARICISPARMSAASTASAARARCMLDGEPVRSCLMYRGAGGRPSRHHGRGPRAAGRTPERPAGQLLRDARAAVRLLHARHADRGAGAARRQSAADARTRSAMRSAAISAAAPAISRSSRRSRSRRSASPERRK